MKTTLILFVTAVFVLPNLVATTVIKNVKQETEKATLVFDGYEGGLYFFTNEDKMAITVEAKDDTPVHDFDLINDDYIGKKFNVTIEKSSEESNVIPVENIKYIVAATP